MQPGRTTITGGGTMEVVAAAPRCQLLLILLMSAVMLLPGTSGSLLLVQRTVTRTIVLQETIGKGSCFFLSLPIPILDCQHTWCCCGIPSDFYCATQPCTSNPAPDHQRPPPAPHLACISTYELPQLHSRTQENTDTIGPRGSLPSDLTQFACSALAQNLVDASFMTEGFRDIGLAIVFQEAFIVKQLLIIQTTAKNLYCAQV
ncbi:hypothetical protein STEG23_015904 [Scotinomys teguina]